MVPIPDSAFQTTRPMQPVVTPRVQRIRQQISLQELELRLARLGLPCLNSRDQQ